VRFKSTSAIPEQQFPSQWDLKSMGWPDPLSPSAFGEKRTPASSPYPGPAAQDEATASGREWCPAVLRLALQPNCSCDGPSNFAILKCSAIRDQQELRKLLDVRFPINSFGRLHVTNSSMKSVDRLFMATVKQFVIISLSKTATQSVDLDAFESSRGSLKRLEIIHNELQSFPFAELSVFKRLTHLDLHHNQFTSIPDYAFGHNDHIRSIDVSYNKISYVGSYAFDELPALEKLDLRFNRLKVINNHAFATRVTNTGLQIDLSNNKIFFLSDGTFDGQSPKELNLSGNALNKLPEKHFFSLLTSRVKLGGVIDVSSK
jgi:hypothetical protein